MNTNVQETHLGSLQINQWVTNKLSRTVKGNLSAPFRNMELCADVLYFLFLRVQCSGLSLSPARGICWCVFCEIEKV
jgi:hypothetical protein